MAHKTISCALEGEGQYADKGYFFHNDQYSRYDFYEHSPAYNTMTLAQALHNPSSYVCFAEHLYYLKDERFGAGKPNL